MNDTYLVHHGIKGQKWGVRRYQNPDGTLTREGIEKYGTVENFNAAQKYKKRRNVAIAAGAVGLAATAAIAVHIGKKYIADDILPKSGNIGIQNIAPKGRNFDTSFYATHTKEDRLKYLKVFLTNNKTKHLVGGRDTVSTFAPTKDLKIAGMGQQYKALGELMKENGGQLNFDRRVGENIIPETYKNNFFSKMRFFDQFGGFNETDRQKFLGKLGEKGYDGMKDFIDMNLGQGTAPMVMRNSNNLKKVSEVTFSPKNMDILTKSIKRRKFTKIPVQSALEKAVFPASAIFGISSGITAGKMQKKYQQTKQKRR